MAQFLGSGRVKKTDRNVEGNPVTVYKRANLKLAHGKILIIPLVHGRDKGVEVNGDATCVSAFPHKSPLKGCTCGFYAYTSREDAVSHPQGGSVVLKAVASGKMLQYLKGYRYGHQRVEQVEVTHCTWCDSSAYRFAIAPTGELYPMCRSHASETAMKTLRFQDFEDMASSGLPSGAPRITIKADTYESFQNTVKYFSTTRAARNSGIILSGLAALGYLARRR